MPYIAEEVKQNRRSALAQLCELLIADGLTTNEALSKRTGYTIRAVQKARRELECANSNSRTLVRPRTLVRNSSSPVKERSPAPLKENTTPTRNVEPSGSVVALRDLAKLLDEACGNAVADPAQCPGIANLMMPQMWIREGADLHAVILPKLREICTRRVARNQPVVTSWAYFTDAIREAAALVAAGLPPVPVNVVQMRGSSGGMAALDRLAAAGA